MISRTLRCSSKGWRRALRISLPPRLLSTETETRSDYCEMSGPGCAHVLACNNTDRRCASDERHGAVSNEARSVVRDVSGQQDPLRHHPGRRDKVAFGDGLVPPVSGRVTDAMGTMQFVIAATVIFTAGVMRAEACAHGRGDR